MVSAKAKQYCCLFVLTILADVAANVWLTIGLQTNEERFSWSSLFNFSSRSWDLAFFCTIRVIVLLAAAILAIFFGTESNYQKNGAHNCRCCTRCQPKRNRMLQESEANKDGYISLGITEDSADSFTTIIKEPLGPGRSRGQFTVLRQREKLSIKSKASRNKNIIYGFVFLMNTAFSVYCGVKCVGFDYQHNLFWGALVMGTSPLWINLQFFSFRLFVNEIVKLEGRLFAAVHHHAMHLKALPCNWCDLCHKQIKEKQGWRCHMCDFDVCNHCAMRENKAGSEGLVRGDRGIKESEEITSYKYFCRAMRLMATHRILVLVSFMCLLVNCATQLILPNYTGKILDSVAKKEQSTFQSTLTVYLICASLTGLFGGIRNLCISITGRKIATDVRIKLFSSIMVQDIAFFDGQMTGQLTARLTNDASAMVSPMNTLMNTILTNSIYLFGGLIFCVYTSWRLSIIAFTSIGPIIFLTTVYARFSGRLNSQIWSALGDANSVATEAFSNVRAVRAFGQDKREIDRFSKSINHAMDRGIIDAIAAAGTFALTNYLDLGASLLILAYGGYEAIKENGTLTIGNLITFQLYWGMINGAYQALTGVWSSLTQSAAAATRVLTLMDNLPDINLFTGICVDSDIKFNLEFKHVKFFYQMRPENIVLRDLNLKIEHEKVVALVGRSGGGKSTISHLLMRFYDPKGGAILLDGVDLREYNLSSLHKEIGIVAQDTQLFNMTIEQNISYGIEKYTVSEILQAAKLANAHDFIMELDEGYQTKIGERGNRISGGQKQRIALAQVFLRRPKLLILDEATSALDAESEALVQESIDRLIATGGCTVLLIAHRLSTVLKADTIAVVDKGQIVEHGSHEELLIQDGIYAKLVNRQQFKQNQKLNVDELIDKIRNGGEG